MAKLKFDDVINKISCMIDATNYTDKDKCKKDGGAIRNRLKSISIDIKELANKITIDNYSFCPAILVNGKKEENWKHQELFALDFDKSSIKEEMKKINDLELPISFAYTSLSHSPKQDKFRIVFQFNRVINKMDEMKKISATFKALFSTADSRCFSLESYFFPGKELINNDFDTLDVDKFLDAHKDLKITIKEKTINKDVEVTEEILISNTDVNSTIINFFKTHNETELKKLFNMKPVTLENNSDYVNYICNINIATILGINNPKKFRCIFHNDMHPSANIFRDNKDKKQFLYHCAGCKRTLNILGIIELLGKFKSRPKAHEFIRSIFNIKIADSQFKKENQEIFDENMLAIQNDLSVTCPTAYKNIKRNEIYLVQFQILAKQRVTSEELTDDLGRPVFFVYLDEILKIFNLSEKSKRNISDKIALFSFHKFIKKLPDNEIPERLLKRAQAISISNGTNRHVLFFVIDSYTTVHLEEVEKQGEIFKNKHLTTRGVSYEGFLRTFGHEEASKHYPNMSQVWDKKQNKVVERGNTNISEMRNKEIENFMLAEINKNGYIMERDVIEKLEMTNAFVNKKTGEANKTAVYTQIKKSLPNILDSYNLKRIQTNKKIKEQYKLDLPAKSFPCIIVKK
jgi:hypothetical protein